MDDKEVSAAAAPLAAAWLARVDMKEMPAPQHAPKTRIDAYRIQDRVADLIGQLVAGWKFGATSPAVRRGEGHSGAVVGRVFASVLHKSPARVASSDAPQARIEGEFVFRYLSDLPPRAAPYTAQEIARSLVLHPGLEIIGNRYPKPLARKLSTYEEIADNGTGWALIVGEPLSDWASLELSHLHIRLMVDGSDPAENFLGDDRCVPLDVAVECANMLSERGIGVKAGQFITTGGCTAPVAIQAGSSVQADFGPLGKVLVEIE